MSSDARRIRRLETLVNDLTQRLRQTMTTPGKTAEDFYDAIEGLAIVAASVIVGCRSEEALDFFGRRLLTHIDEISRELGDIAAAIKGPGADPMLN